MSIGWIVLGLLAGVIANAIMPGAEHVGSVRWSCCSSGTRSTSDRSR